MSSSDPGKTAPRRALRSNFEPGTSRWAVRRAQWRALGLTDADMEKPKIAVVNTSSELSSCFSHLDGVAAAIKQAIREAGGLPFEVRTAAPSDFITSAGARGGYILPSRDLIANDIEVAVEGALLDGMICLASCDKTTPGQLMAAARLDLPTLVVVCGYQRSGHHKQQHVDIEEVFLAAGHVAAGRMDPAELAAMSEQAVRGPGVCAGIGTANSMHMVCEALGMALPGSAPVAANSPRMMATVAQAGARIVQMVWEDLRPRAILTAEAFANAARLVLALGGSINTIKHLQAIANEAQAGVDVYGLFERLADTTPLIAAIRPNGDHSIEDLERAGGTLAVFKRLAGLYHPEALTVSGRPLGDAVDQAQVRDEAILRPADQPLSTRPSIVILRGSLAPDGGIVKLGLATGKAMRFEGTARVFESQEDAIAALQRGEIERGTVVVMRGLGVRGGPGMGMASRFVFVLDGAGLGEHVAVVTDGQLSGLVNKGLVVGEVSPEAAAGGPLGLVQDGDPIAIDIDARTVDLKVAEQVLARRREAFAPPAPGRVRGWLSVYEQVVRPLPEGAVIAHTGTAGPR
ncbi:dihydroxy-acid dehydratase [Pigmentiphaga sp. GD03639]|uniref:dihydroxy-acid dehydratase n=1 Tax=Pigmentiphaga sp. GD03639 TaxID=2975354 RepID=UPI00244BE671|nr:dihydroxy-acid dehydratase [Pigmentiphaga sp. GD03639]MDH2235511.1 dihydroxy-acid dehydratase [Pigmentiphaga sp. GD03639]